MQVESLLIPSKKIQINSFDDELALPLKQISSEDISNIRQIRIQGNSYSKIFCQQFGKFLCGTQKLDKLDINDIFVGRKKDQIPEAIQFIARGLLTKNLIHLDISNNAVNPFGAKALVIYLEQATSLKTLLIANCGLGIMGVTQISRGLKGTPNLEVFAIGRNRVENDGAIEISKVLQYIPKLKSLHIYQNSIKRDGLTPLLNGLWVHCHQSFQTLDICDNFVRQTATPQLANLIKKCKIRNINLSDALQQGQNEQIISAFEAVENPHLQKVGYNYNELSNELALRFLKVLKNSPLIKLDIVGNQLSDNVQKQFREVLSDKNLELKFEDDDDSEEEMLKAFAELKI